jgi:hypothetical protein
VQIDPERPYTNTDLSCSYTYNDADNDSEKAPLYEWRVANAADQMGTVEGNTATLAASKFAKNQWVTCTVRPNDGYTYGPPASAQVQVQNSAPTATFTSLTPSKPSASSTITCNVSTGDADQDNVNVTYEWYVNDVAVQSGSSNTLSGRFGYPDSVLCKAIPNDGTTNGNSVQGTVNVSINTAPTISSVTNTGSESPATVNTRFTATANGYSDADGNPLGSMNYRWYAGGQLLSGQTSNTLLAGVASAGQTVYAQARPCDSYNTCGSWVSSNSITIADENSPPTAPTVLTDPKFIAFDEDTLQCLIRTPSTDPDGDSVVYEFQWWEARRPEIIYASSVVSFKITNVGDLWNCRARGVDTHGAPSSWSQIVFVEIEPGGGGEPPLIKFKEDTVRALDDAMFEPGGLFDDNTLTLQGEGCATGDTCAIACVDNDKNIYHESTVECLEDNGIGRFSDAILGVTTGDEFSCFALCEDDAGHESVESSVLGVAVCDETYVYEGGDQVLQEANFESASDQSAYTRDESLTLEAHEWLEDTSSARETAAPYTLQSADVTLSVSWGDGELPPVFVDQDDLSDLKCATD